MADEDALNEFVRLNNVFFTAPVDFGGKVTRHIEVDGPLFSLYRPGEDIRCGGSITYRAVALKGPYAWHGLSMEIQDATTWEQHLASPE